MTRTFDENLTLGRRAEDVVLAELLAAGLYVECRRDATGPRGNFSPRMHSSGRHIPVPDFRTSGGGHEAHVEVKGKQWVTWYADDGPPPWEEPDSGGELQHGIDQRALDYYRRTQEQTGLGVMLVVVELVSPHPGLAERDRLITRQATLGAWIDDLHCRRSGSMVYFSRASLSELWVYQLRRCDRIQLGFLLPEVYR
jgi:hypothetical protein